MTEENNNLSTEEEERIINQRRFAPYRYSLRGAVGTLVDTMVLELPGHFAYPLETDQPKIVPRKAEEKKDV